jgi:hypothetical protein
MGSRKPLPTLENYSMTDFQLKTPVALIIFNRPDTTERVFTEIARARPPVLLVIGDGARVNREGEAAKVEATRAIIKRIDWPCKLITNFSEINLGCKLRVSSGLDWVFEQVPEAIILEDDCLPHPTFFRYCEDLLEHYRNDQRISQINGVNLQTNYNKEKESYYYSRNNHIWGWATWSDRWINQYDVEMKIWPEIKEKKVIKDWFSNSSEQNFWTNIFDKTYQGKIDTWDYQWVFASWVQGRLAIMPCQDLIRNIGFGVDATHTTEIGPLSNLQVVEMKFPLIHPKWIYASSLMERQFFNKFNVTPLHKRVRNKLKKFSLYCVENLKVRSQINKK